MYVRFSCQKMPVWEKKIFRLKNTEWTAVFIVFMVYLVVFKY